MAILLSRRARADLDEIRDYTVERWGRGQWLKYYRGLAAAFDLIQARPNKGKNRDLFVPGLMSVLCQKHVIFYRRSNAADGAIVIIRIVHQARHLPALSYYDDLAD